MTLLRDLRGRFFAMPADLLERFVVPSVRNSAPSESQLSMAEPPCDGRDDLAQGAGAVAITILLPHNAMTQITLSARSTVDLAKGGEDADR